MVTPWASLIAGGRVVSEFAMMVFVVSRDEVCDEAGR